MSNYTFEDYKKAIKAKYEEEKKGEYSNNLNSPTSANLRNLCVKRFDSNNNKEDLIAFKSFFDFPFDKDKKNQFGEDELNKLESVRRFLLGRTENPAEDTIQLAAILVDLKPRPFNEYKKQHDADVLKLMKELRSPQIPKEEVASDVLVNEIDRSIDSENEEPQPQQDENLQLETTPEVISTFVATGKPPKLGFRKYLLIAAVLAGLALIIYLSMSRKDCMQWSTDHYERVSCDLDAKGLGSFNVVEPYDKTVFDLRKIKISDTTSCFDKNGDAIIWYAKTANGIDFFNGHGRHPENNNTLKPITKYILNKYVKKQN